MSQLAEAPVEDQAENEDDKDTDGEEPSTEDAAWVLSEASISWEHWHFKEANISLSLVLLSRQFDLHVYHTAKHLMQENGLRLFLFCKMNVPLIIETIFFQIKYYTEQRCFLCVCVWKAAGMRVRNKSDPFDVLLTLQSCVETTSQMMQGFLAIQKLLHLHTS